MKLKTVETTVGLMVIATVASFIMLSLQVSGMTNFFKKEQGYIIRTQFSNVGGLKVRSKVAISGVTVGRVQSIELDPESFNATVELMLSSEIKVPDDSHASIFTAGLLGDNYVGLSPGFSPTHILANGVIPIEQTESAMVLEQLISKFVAGGSSKK